MPPRGASKRLALLLLVLATVGPPGVLSEQNVGCIFSKSLCLKEEWCYNDEAFGRCVTGTGDLTEDDLFRFDLERESLHELKSELTRLYALGYRWSHGYTQCRLQTMLYAIKNELDFDPNSCSDLTDSDLGSAVKVLEGQVPVNPKEIAIIKYTPSVDKPHGEYADEVYYPPVDNGARETLREKIMPSNGIDIMDMEDPNVEYAMIKRSYIPQMRRRSITPFFDERYGIPKYRRANPDSLDSLEFLENYGNDIPEPKIANLYPEGNFGATADIVGAMFPVNKLMNDLQLSPTEMRKFLSTENYQTLNRLLEEYEGESRMTPPIKNMEEPLHHQNIPDDRLELAFNKPNAFSAGWSLNENIDEPLPESRIYYDENNDVDQAEYGSGYQVHPEEIFSERKTDYYGPLSRNEEIFRELKQQQDLQNKNFEQRWGKMKPMVYTEGGAVPEDIGDKFDSTESRLITRENINNILDRYNLGFKRPERLDVKKPGPPFDQQISDPTIRNSQLQKNKEETFLPSMMKKEPRNPVTYQEYKPYGNEDDTNDYVYVQLNTEISSWSQGKSVIGNISQLLHLENSAFSDGKVEAYAVSFKVNLNSRSYDASEVAKIIIEKMDELSEKTGLEIMAAGIGDKNGIKTIISSKLNTESQYIVIFLVCGVLVAMIIAAALLILIRRHIKIKEKLSGLSRPDTEASKDYQDLCRARMATKTQPAESSVPGRITSLSRESEQSPSSRSSTSSWSEEPALHNMDISTGHMVLSYMEDHLKNKDRLEQEWVALCAYVAEPCETSIALKKENLEKNRYPEIVPYDHARVVLNELSNVSGSDYINASSITDHDPRNPAYIATQGPLPLTAPDFWQLIWEQGAVVIVMLTRLTEGGAAMCHRYWPEEGSEVYHIYEVHLVSEHIWCDDYLVRSFYLKNVRTGETRTVTQFHFLSWPEGGVPASTKALLEFRRKVNKSYRGRSCPIVVHCSDGAGRTGTYSLIDMVLSRMAKGAKEIDIAATLEHLRDQRPKMVATKQQFEFVLTAVAEEVHAILKALPPQPVPTQSQEKQEK